MAGGASNGLGEGGAPHDGGGSTATQIDGRGLTGGGPAPPPDVRNGVAIAALVIGLLTLVVLPLAPMLGIAGVVLGLIGYGRSRHLPGHRGRAAALAGLGLSVVGGILGTALYGLALRSTWRTECAANLSQLGRALAIYAHDNEGWFPVRMYHEPPEDAGEETLVSFVGQMGALWRTRLDSQPPGIYKESLGYTPNVPDLVEKQNSVHPSMSLFMLIADGTLRPDQFICPAAGDQVDDMQIAPGTPPVTGDAGLNQYDFKGHTYLSYGYQVPFGRFARPRLALDPRMPVAADKGPFFRAGPPRADGTVPDQPVQTPGSSVTIANAGAAAQVQRPRTDTGGRSTAAITGGPGRTCCAWTAACSSRRSRSWVSAATISTRCRGRATASSTCCWGACRRIGWVRGRTRTR